MVHRMQRVDVVLDQRLRDERSPWWCSEADKIGAAVAAEET